MSRERRQTFFFTFELVLGSLPSPCPRMTGEHFWKFRDPPEKRKGAHRQHGKKERRSIQQSNGIFPPPNLCCRSCLSLPSSYLYPGISLSPPPPPPLLSTACNTVLELRRAGQACSASAAASKNATCSTPSPRPLHGRALPA